MASPTLPFILQRRAKLSNMAGLGHWKWVHTRLQLPHWGQSSRGSYRVCRLWCPMHLLFGSHLLLTSHVTLSEALNPSQLSFLDNTKLRTSLLGQVHRLLSSWPERRRPMSAGFRWLVWLCCHYSRSSCASSPLSTFVAGTQVHTCWAALCVSRRIKLHTLVHSCHSEKSSLSHSV